MLYKKARDRMVKALLELREYREYSPEDIAITIRECKGGDAFLSELLHAFLTYARDIDQID